MTYSDEEIKSRLQLGEDSNWEFKEVVFSGTRLKGPRRADWADEISAFANASGGTLVCSVTDNGDVKEMSKEQINSLEHLIAEISSNSIRPPIRVNVSRMASSEGKAFLVVEVPEGHAQHESPGGSFIRVGSTKQKMTSEERLRLAQKRGQASFLWFDKQPVDGTGFETLDTLLWKPLISVEGGADPALALEKMGLLAEEQNGTLRATVAGVLLCSNSPENWLPNACITATRYRGVDRASGQLDAQEICGPLDKQVRESLAFAVRNMRVAARKEPARQDLSQYSEKALFEAFVNAVVHRDYSIRGSRIRLAMFEDRLEICSPGNLPNNLTVGSMGERQSTRNEVLTSVMGRMDVGGIEAAGGRQFFMERRGDGVPIIRRETQELSGVLPDFRLVDDAELILSIPAAPLISTPTTAVISVRSVGEPLANAVVLALFPNKTWKQAVTDANGEAVVDLHSTHLPMVVFAAAQGFAAGIEQDWIPAQRPLALEMKPMPGGGSVILQEATGHIPGLSGRLNPIRDSLDRTYLYASNISINQGRQQPVHFTFSEELRLTDAEGREVDFTCGEHSGQISSLGIPALYRRRTCRMSGPTCLSWHHETINA